MKTTQEKAIRDAEIYNAYLCGNNDKLNDLKRKYLISELDFQHIINKRRHYTQESLSRIKDDYFLCNLYLELLKHDVPNRIASRIVVCLYQNRVDRTIEDVKNWCVNYNPEHPYLSSPGYRNFGRTSYIHLKRYLTETGHLTSEDEEKINKHDKPIIRYVIDINGSSIYYKTKKAAENDLKAFRVYEGAIHEKRASEIHTEEFSKA